MFNEKKTWKELSDEQKGIYREFNMVIVILYSVITFITEFGAMFLLPLLISRLTSFTYFGAFIIYLGADYIFSKIILAVTKAKGKNMEDN